MVHPHQTGFYICQVVNSQFSCKGGRSGGLLCPFIYGIRSTYKRGAKNITLALFIFFSLNVTMSALLFICPFIQVDYSINRSVSLMQEDDEWMCNNLTTSMRSGVNPPPHRPTSVSRSCNACGSSGSQQRHVVLLVTSPATPLTKEGNKHPSRRNGTQREREVGRRGKGELQATYLYAAWHRGLHHVNATKSVKTPPGPERSFDHFIQVNREDKKRNFDFSR